MMDLPVQTVHTANSEIVMRVDETSLNVSNVVAIDVMHYVN